MASHFHQDGLVIAMDDFQVGRHTQTRSIRQEHLPGRVHLITVFPSPKHAHEDPSQISPPDNHEWPWHALFKVS